jgi:hypothetical protein
MVSGSAFNPKKGHPAKAGRRTLYCLPNKSGMIVQGARNHFTAGVLKK